MGRVTTVLLLSSFLAASACSSSGKGGKGTGEDPSSGNIPLAEAGKELGDVNFAFNSSEISSNGLSTLDKNSRWLLDTGKKATIEGHCDERGTVEYNLALGERRARSAYDYLRSKGVKADQLSTVSYGEELPLDPGHTEDAWAKNRRAHFSLK